MENISNFIRGCRAIGVPEYSLFETVDLFEGKDIGLVVKCLVRDIDTFFSTKYSGVLCEIPSCEISTCFFSEIGDPA